MSDSKNFLLGVFDDEDVLLKAVGKIRGAGVKIHEVYSPFPVHGLDEELGYKRSRLPIAAFMFGALGTTLALVMQIWMLGVDWPMIIGGKNFIALPDFVPVTFELTVLLAAFGMVGTFLVASDLKPWKDPKMLDLRITDDKHVMAIDLGKNAGLQEAQINALLKDSGAVEVNNKNVEE
ncbi:MULTISPECIES: DUF3341 domain-containing protein [Roseivirga]|jgi:hypothetical protein|uniref:Membrane protein n=1 Tax=Roseivirga thermotolerans TaxID=1758176 RepID=A0ABQ3I660_9BACT|nr:MULTISPECIES: DUF3341 domain-containing protein [Roseivirga]MEC7752384.1 DUF3341 domain-containing protein [Bacteroidota bacterium]GHE67841.1 membrane protein [Roseivirga thermotolerans]|tara:strand:+ start:6455 stop:6988 length:534 start_codon:yes stop_codon:yes gene_type:complete